MSKKKKIEIPILPAVIVLILLIILIHFCFAQAMASNVNNVIAEQPIEVATADEADNDTTTNYIINEQIVESEEPAEEEVIDEVAQSDPEINYDQQVIQEAPKTHTSDEPVRKAVSPVYHKTKSGVVYYTIGQINIPKVKINYPIISETNNTLMKIGITKYWGCNPNEVGNMCLVGHNYRNDGKFFSKLHYVTNGDLIYVTDLYGLTYKYVVYKTMIVDPYDTSCTSQLTDGRMDITLITCYNSGTQRYVVKAAAQ